MSSVPAQSKKILFIQNRILHYRKPFYEFFGRRHEVTVVHSGPPVCRGDESYRERCIEAKSIGPFRIQTNLRAVVQESGCDVVVAMFDIRWLSTLAVMFQYDRKLRWIWWGLDEGRSKLALMAKIAVAWRDNPVVFYNQHVARKFALLGLDERKLYVANNTFHVENSFPSHKGVRKDAFINVGSLDARKQNDVLVRVFQRVLLRSKQDLKLILIGDGDQRESLAALIRDLNLTDRVLLLPGMHAESELAPFYGRAIASVSFGQAGLAVLQSMAFGVPFVTKENAISGGEIHNIITNRNGILCQDHPESLEASMLKLAVDREYARSLGRNAFEYYRDHASISGMIDGFEAAIAYSG